MATIRDLIEAALDSGDADLKTSLTAKDAVLLADNGDETMTFWIEEGFCEADTPTAVMTVEELLKKSLESHTGEELEGPIEDVAVIVSFLGKDVFIEIGEFEGDEDESA